MKRTEKQDVRIMKFMASICKTIGLDGWTLSLSERQPEGKDEQMAWAMIEVVPYRRIAVVSLSPEFLQAGHRNILHVLIHECCHLYFADMRQYVADLQETNVMSDSAHSLFATTTHTYEELAVDRMAGAWADIMWEWETVQRALRRITKQVERSI